MKRSVIERVREIAAGSWLPVVESKVAGPYGLVIEFTSFTGSDETAQEREERLRGNETAELAKWLLELFDENEAQADYTLRVLEYLQTLTPVGV